MGVGNDMDEENDDLWSDWLDTCMRAGGPVIVYQPICELADGKHAVGYEALARFGELGPEEWFAAAGRLGRRVELERVALRNALNCLDQVPEGCYLSVNASFGLISEPETIGLIGGYDLTRIQLEITEEAVLIDAVVETMQPLRESGMRLAVDDLGTGFSTLQQVVLVMPDVFKTDRWLARGIDTDEGWPQRATVSSLVQLASRLNLEITAEGIETQQQLEAFRLLGVLYGQGFLMGRPGALPN